MKLDQACAFPIAFGRHRGRTIGWVAKHVPRGLSYVAKLYESQNLHDDVREALRSFLAAHAMQPYLRKALGENYRPETYMLPSTHCGCRLCGSALRGRPVTSQDTRCEHRNIVLRQEEVGWDCACGWSISTVYRYPILCEECSAGEGGALFDPPKRKPAQRAVTDR